MRRHELDDYQELDTDGNRFEDTGDEVGERFTETKALIDGNNTPKNEGVSFSKFLFLFLLVVFVAILLLVIFGMIPIA